MSDQLHLRIPEPELMEEMEQARAYAEADFHEPHNMFVQAFGERFGPNPSGVFLDLGCGAADISCRFARAFPETTIHGIDGSAAMLKFAKKIIAERNLSHKITVFRHTIPVARLPHRDYHGIIVNSLLHHLPDPLVLWQTIKQVAHQDAAVFVMDLLRPKSREDAERIVNTYSGKEPQILKRDFFNSLLAAFRPEEILIQLKEKGLDYLEIETVSDRHLIVWGRLR